MSNAKFHIRKRVNEKFYFILNSGNENTILVGEGYSNKKDCRKGVDLVKQHSGKDEQYERKRSSAIDKYFFVLKSSSGDIIATSEEYDSANEMEEGIETVKKNAAEAAVVESE